MRVDFRVHTNPLSSKSMMTPEQAIQAARHAKLDGIVLTETNISRSAAGFMRLHDYGQRFGVTVFQGVHLHTVLGPLLVYGPSIGQSGNDGIRVKTVLDTAAAVEYARAQGWAVVLAAPFQYGVGPENGMCQPWRDSSDPVGNAVANLGHVIRKMHGVEISASASKEDNGFAEALAREFALPIIVGSGACHPRHIRPGCWTRTADSVTVSEKIASRLIAASTRGTHSGIFRTPDLEGIYKLAGPNRRSD